MAIVANRGGFVPRRQSDLVQMKILNAVLFQGTWFASVMGGAGLGLLGLACLSAYSIYAETFKIDIRFVMGLAFLGFVLDTVWIWLGILDYGDGPFAPLWIVILWAAIGFTACHSLRFFSQRPMLGGLFAAVAAPISYFAGQRLGAAVLVETGGLIFVSIVWGVLFMGLFRLVEVVDGGSRH